MLRGIALAAMTAVLTVPSFAGEWKKTFIVRDGAKVEVRADDAIVRVVGNAESRVIATVTTEGVAISDDAVRVTTIHAGNSVKVTIDVAKQVRSAAEAGKVEIVIALPESAALQAKTGAGKIFAEHKNGSITVSGKDTRKEVAADTGFVFSTKTGV